MQTPSVHIMLSENPVTADIFRLFGAFIREHTKAGQLGLADALREIRREFVIRTFEKLYLDNMEIPQNPTTIDETL